MSTRVDPTSVAYMFKEQLALGETDYVDEANEWEAESGMGCIFDDESDDELPTSYYGADYRARTSERENNRLDFDDKIIYSDVPPAPPAPVSSAPASSAVPPATVDLVIPKITAADILGTLDAINTAPDNTPQAASRAALPVEPIVIYELPNDNISDLGCEKAFARFVTEMKKPKPPPQPVYNPSYNPSYNMSHGLYSPYRYTAQEYTPRGRKSQQDTDSVLGMLNNMMARFEYLGRKFDNMLERIVRLESTQQTITARMQISRAISNENSRKLDRVIEILGADNKDDIQPGTICSAEDVANMLSDQFTTPIDKRFAIDDPIDGLVAESIGATDKMDSTH